VRPRWGATAAGRRISAGIGPPTPRSFRRNGHRQAGNFRRNFPRPPTRNVRRNLPWTGRSVRRNGSGRAGRPGEIGRLLRSVGTIHRMKFWERLFTASSVVAIVLYSVATLCSLAVSARSVAGN